MTEREQFEAWCEDEGINPEKSALTGVYISPAARVGWRSWQASRRAALEESAKVCDEISTDFNRRRKTSDNPTYMEGKSDGAEACATALIRALSHAKEEL